MATGSFHWVDYVVFAGMLVISLGIGIYFALAGGGQKSTGEYLMGNRNLKIIPVALSLIVSFVSSVGILGIPAEMYSYGTQFSMYVFAAAIGCVYGAFLFVPVLYPLKLTSSYEYFELRYKSKFPRMIGAVINIFNGVFSTAAVLVAPSIALYSVSGMPVWISMVVCALVGTLYTCLGGMKAVIWTDVFQALVIFLGMIAVVITGVVKVGGFGEVWRLNEEWDRIEFFNMDLDPRTRTTFWSVVVVMSFLYMTMTTSQMAVQRYCALPTMKAAQRSVLLNIPGFVLIGALSSLAGVAVFAYYAKQGCDPLSSGKITNPNQILPYFVNDVMGYPGLTGLFVSCLYSGSLSSLSSTLNAMAAVTWEDMLKWKYDHLSDQKKTNITKALVMMYGTASLATSFLVVQMGGTFIQIVFSVMGTTYGPIMGMFFLGALWPRAGPNGAMLGVVIGFGISVWMSVGSFLLHFYETPLPFPTDTCPAMNRSSAYGTLGMMMSLTNNTHVYNDTLGHPMPPRREFVGLENMYAISYLWYPTVGVVCVLVIGISTSCIPGFRQKGYVPKKYLFPFMRRCAGSCQRDKTMCHVDDDSDEDNNLNVRRHIEMNSMPSWRGSQSPLFQFKFKKVTDTNGAVPTDDNEVDADSDNEATINDTPADASLLKMDFNARAKPDIVDKYNFNLEDM